MVGMKLAVGSDEKTGLTDFVLEELPKRGNKVTAYGPMAGEQMGWPDVEEKIGVEVSSGRADQGIVFCWTGTGVYIAANRCQVFVRLSVGTRRLRRGRGSGTTPTRWL